MDSTIADRPGPEDRTLNIDTLKLPSRSVGEVVEEAGEKVPWIIEDILARGAVTDFFGPAKKGGKTTFWCHAIAAGARGEPVAGFDTVSAKYLYLTEQGTNFALSLSDAGLEEYPHYVRVVQYKDVSAAQWKALIEDAASDCKALGFDALIVDTFAVFAKLKGSEENDSGAVTDRLRVLNLVAQKNDIGAVLIRHAGKDGKGRGSSAFEAEADIVVGIGRPEGNHGPNIRKLEAIGRYGEWERNIELQGGRYVSLGTDSKIEFNKAVSFIRSVLPESPDDGLRKSEIMDLRQEANEGIKPTTADRALGWMVEQGEAGMRQENHQRGKPKVYWKAVRG